MDHRTLHGFVTDGVLQDSEMPVRPETFLTVGLLLVLLAWLCCGAGCGDGAPAGSQTSVRHGELDDFVPPPLGDLQRTVSVVLSDLEFPETVQRPVDVAVVESGRIRFRVTSNSRTPQVLSGLESLSFQDKDKRFEAFRAGLNLEHVYCGHRDVRNRFSPRKHTYLVSRERDGHSVFLVRPATQSPWSVEHATRLAVTPPDAVDIDFRCRFRDVSAFGARGYVTFFWANYMRELHEAAVHFRSVSEQGGSEGRIRAESMDGWTVGTYRAATASALEFDADHNMALNLRSFEWPRITRPVLYSRSADGMVLILMFDRLRTDVDEIRFSHFPPAVDFQYVIHEVKKGRRYGFRARLIWRPWTTQEDCLQAWHAWHRDPGSTDGP